MFVKNEGMGSGGRKGEGIKKKKNKDNMMK